MGRTDAAKVAMQGGAKASTRRLIEASEPVGGRSSWVSRAQELVKEWRDEVAPLANSDAVPIIPQRLCTEITKWMPSNGMLVADTGHAGIWTGSMVDLKEPTQGYIRCAG